jgi:hypothetical protein
VRAVFELGLMIVRISLSKRKAGQFEVSREHSQKVKDNFGGVLCNNNKETRKISWETLG